MTTMKLGKPRSTVPCLWVLGAWLIGPQVVFGQLGFDSFTNPFLWNSPTFFQPIAVPFTAAAAATGSGGFGIFGWILALLYLIPQVLSALFGGAGTAF